ncbi:hypothetical protein [Corynebacterium anserum]|uniref:Uncharacterized protein n=1 Tax=Corynebacterium anserum TaxID=2684406 RepID=A0A7G7YPM6_9CORY|nr:hypothetical protein [Corynebacterium anserum]MBC2682083.1 hypothetical protein [Corynebacterium anserum]QNH96446.1 hypothetical protein GP473_07075 [Corynebacterium anserum]
MKETRTKQNSGRPAPPPAVKLAGILGLIQGGAGIGFGIILIIREANGFHDPGAVISGYGTAAWFLFFFGAVALAGYFLSTGRKWGRGPVVMLQLCLLGVAYYMFTSGRPDLGVPTALMAALGLILLFSPQAVDWAATRYAE